MIGRSMSMWALRALVVMTCASSAALVASPALAEVKHEGEWPSSEERVTLDIERKPRSEAIKELAKAAGWSIVFHGFVMPTPVDVHVKDQPASKVLDLILDESGDYHVKRDGTLIVISRESQAEADRDFDVKVVVPKIAPVPPLPPLPPVVPTPPGSGTVVEEDDDHLVQIDDDGDRLVTGGSLRVEKGEVVHDVTVLGGALDVYGTVTGDIAVLGGSARIHEGAQVEGDAETLGGKLVIEDGAVVEGDVEVVGGQLERGKGAVIEGEIKGPHKYKHKKNKKDHADKSGDEAKPTTLRSLAEDAGNSVTRAALLFVFGAVLLSLMTDRMERLKLQIATKPMRSFATGVIGVIAAVVLLIALCVTIVGIPFAIIGVLGACVGAFAGVAAVLETVGSGLIGHKTKNPYMHLAFGCLLFLLIGSIPFVGGFVKAAVVLVGIGSVVATRGAGLFNSVTRSTGSPYRDASAS